MVVFSEEVSQARREGKALVALESTIISHGMPYPQNVETALRVEQAVRAEGAVPATIAVMNGRLCAGLTIDELEVLGKAGRQTVKASRRDIPVLEALKKNGTTTVAATMIIARMSGINLFATGGIGGVHRGAEKTFDISADLQEFVRTNVAVVCAGAKSILDLSLTLEYLETFGVPVLGFKTDEFPAFYCRESGLQVNYSTDNERDIAKILKCKWSNEELYGGVIIANPIPSEFSLDKSEMDIAIHDALGIAEMNGVRGKEVTPFLLAEIEKLTKSASLKANIELVLNNASLASRIAVEYQAMK